MQLWYFGCWDPISTWDIGKVALIRIGQSSSLELAFDVELGLCSQQLLQWPPLGCCMMLRPLGATRDHTALKFWRSNVTAKHSLSPQPSPFWDIPVIVCSQDPFVQDVWTKRGCSSVLLMFSLCSATVPSFVFLC